jgi:Tol biopolymer transport system component
MVAVPMAFLLLGTGVATRFLVPKGEVAEPVEASMTPVVTWPGEKGDGRISPDGSKVSFLAERGGTTSVWVRERGTREPRPLEVRSATIRSHAWSPDGRQLALITWQVGETYLQVVPAGGGSPVRSWRIENHFYGGRLIRWIGDHLYLEKVGSGLWRLHLKTGEMVQLLEEDHRGDYRAYFDVRGDEEALVYSLKQDGGWSIWTSDMAGGGATLLTDQSVQSVLPRWLGQQGEAILFTSTRSKQADLWHLDVKTRRARQVTFSHHVEYVQDTSLDGELAVFTEIEHDADLGMLDLRTGSWMEVTADTRQDLSPSVSRDGVRVAFLRARPGLEVFPVFYSVETQLGELTATGFEELQRVAGESAISSLSPDGRLLALVRVAGGKPRELGILEIDSGHEWPVSEAFLSSNFHPDPIEWMHRNLAWTPGSETLVFAALGEESAYEIRRAWPGSDPAETEVLVGTETRPMDLLVSEDGRRLAYVVESWTEPKWFEVRVHDLESGEDRLWLRGPPPQGARTHLRGWTPDGEGLWMLRSTLDDNRSDRIEVFRLEPSTGAHPVATLEGGFAGTVRMDAGGSRLFLTCQNAQSGAHDLCRLDLETGAFDRLTRNRLPGVTYSATQLVDENTLLCSRHGKRQSIWQIRFEE